MRERSIIEIVGDISSCIEVQTLKGKKISKPMFLFGDSVYVNNMLSLFSRSSKTNAIRFPLITLFVPFNEVRTDKNLATSAKIKLMIAVDTVSSYTNEQRLDSSFIRILRPIYDGFIDGVRRSSELVAPYDGQIPHTYRERYDLGARGAMDSNNKELNTLIDAIEIDNLVINVKKDRCLWQQ